MNETAFRFGRQDELFGVYHAPAAEGRRELAVVFCAPFAEEKKCSYRAFVEAARAFAAAGMPCLRFDYFGTGDSEGEFSEFAPSRAIEGIVAAAEKARELARVSRVVLLGLRLGGTLALAAAPRAKAEDVILWQPVVDGRSFFDLFIKRQVLRRQLIGGGAGEGMCSSERSDVRTFGRSDEHIAQQQGREQEGMCSPLRTGEHLPGEVIDLDGFALSKAAAEEIRGLNCADAAKKYEGKIHLLQISHSLGQSREHRQFMEACGGRLVFAAIVCEPFWNRIEIADAKPVIDRTLEWLSAQANTSSFSAHI